MSQTKKVMDQKDLIKIGRQVEKIAPQWNQVINILNMELDEEGDTMIALLEIKKIIDGAK